MSLMELFSNYSANTTFIQTETAKGNLGNHSPCPSVTAIAPADSGSNSSNQGNQSNNINKDKLVNDNILEYFEERAAIMEFDGGLSRAKAEQAATQTIRVYCYRVKDKPSAVLTVLMPNTELDEAYQKLKLMYGDRLLNVYESPRFIIETSPIIKVSISQAMAKNPPA